MNLIFAILLALLSIFIYGVLVFLKCEIDFERSMRIEIWNRVNHLEEILKGAVRCSNPETSEKNPVEEHYKPLETPGELFTCTACGLKTSKRFVSKDYPDWNFCSRCTPENSKELI